jgi:hypothetical protein
MLHRSRLHKGHAEHAKLPHGQQRLGGHRLQFRGWEATATPTRVEGGRRWGPTLRIQQQQHWDLLDRELDVGSTPQNQLDGGAGANPVRGG